MGEGQGGGGKKSFHYFLLSPSPYFLPIREGEFILDNFIEVFAKCYITPGGPEIQLIFPAAPA